jgi:hypothetical protein
MVGTRSQGAFAIVAMMALAGIGRACTTFGEEDDAATAPVPAKEAGAGGPFCATQPSSLFLCDDFDDEAKGPLGYKWTENTASRGVGERDSNAFRSPPFSFVARSTEDGQGWAYLDKLIDPPTKTHIVTSFDVRIDDLGSTYATLWTLRAISADDKAWSLFLRITKEGSLELGESDPTTQIGMFPFSRNPAPKDWKRITIDVELAGSPQVRAFVDDATEPVARGTLQPMFVSDKKKVSVGIAYFTVAGWRAHVDNVTIALP